MKQGCTSCGLTGTDLLSGLLVWLLSGRGLDLDLEFLLVTWAVPHFSPMGPLRGVVQSLGTCSPSSKDMTEPGNEHLAPTVGATIA